MPESTESEGAEHPGSDFPMTLDESRASLDRLRKDAPDLFAGAPPSGTGRGIDAYQPEDLPKVYCNACNIFHDALGRFPDLVRPQSTADHFFAMKFFHPIPLKPNPSDKLAAISYLPAEMRNRVGWPRRVWVSDQPALPEPGAVAPGTYWLKLSKGWGMNRKVVWPPGDAERDELEAMARHWWHRPYGVGWGEWWYGLGKPRLFLEQDLSGMMVNRPEIKVFVRDGEVKMLYSIWSLSDGRLEQSYFDASLRRLPGRSPKFGPLDEPLPDTIGLMMEAAAEIGKRFRVVRVDFINAAGPIPYLGELTLCHVNAGNVLSPPEFDKWVCRQLFE